MKTEKKPELSIYFHIRSQKYLIGTEEQHKQWQKDGVKENMYAVCETRAKSEKVIEQYNKTK